MNALRTTACCRSNAVFPGTGISAHTGIAMPIMLPPPCFISTLAPREMLAAVHIEFHKLNMGRVLFPLAKEHADQMLKKTLLLHGTIRRGNIS